MYVYPPGPPFPTLYTNKSSYKPLCDLRKAGYYYIEGHLAPTIDFEQIGRNNYRPYVELVFKRARVPEVLLAIPKSFTI